MITGPYLHKSIAVPNAVIRVTLATGGEGGWNVNYAVFANMVETDPLETFMLPVGYSSGEDPIGMAEDLLLEMPRFVNWTRVSAKRFTHLAFYRLFTIAERIAIRDTAKLDPRLEDYIDLLRMAKYVDLTDPDTVAGVNTLEAAGLLAAGRATQILNGVQPQ